MADRVFKRSKTLSYSIAALAADAVLTEALTRKKMVPIDDVDWTSITVEVNVTAFTGTSCVFGLLTTNDPNYEGATTDTVAKKGDGSTAFQSAAITQTGRYRFSGVKGAANGSTASDIGKLLGVLYDTTSATVTADVFVHIQGADR